MKKVFLSIFLFSIFGCVPKTNLSGSWYSCSKRGDYIEIHFKKNQYKYSTNFITPSNWNKFEVLGDTLIQYDKFLFKDSIISVKSKFHFKDKDELKLTYYTSDEKWTFVRIHEKIKSLENNLLLERKTIERSKKAECIDKRTPKERKRDPLDNHFEF